jgi:hypothetical protein
MLKKQLSVQRLPDCSENPFFRFLEKDCNGKPEQKLHKAVKGHSPQLIKKIENEIIYNRSIMPAMPCPPPTQALTMPYFLLRRCMSFNNCTVSLLPVQPNG